MKLQPVELEADAWDALLAEHEAGTPFHRAWWYRGWGMSPQVHAVADGSGRVYGGCLLGLKRRGPWQCVERPPFTALNGPLVFGEVSRPQRLEILEALLDAMQGIALTDFVLEPGDIDALPWLWHNYRQQLRLTYVIPTAWANDWRERISRHHRRNLRKAHQALTGTHQIERGDDPAAIADFLQDVANEKGFAPVSAEAWKSWAAARRDIDTACYRLVVDGETTAVGLVIADARCAWYLIGGVVRGAAGGMPHAMVLMERMIDDALASGRDFDFEGSVLPGVERFFRGWGAEPRPIVRMTKIQPLPLQLAWWWRQRRRH